MARMANISQELVDFAIDTMIKASTAEELRAAQAIVFPQKLKLTLKETGKLIGCSRATVVRLRAKFRHACHSGKDMLKEKKEWGGRRREYLTKQEEKEFLAGFLEGASKGQILVVSKVKASYEAKVGRKVAGSTVYRLLARHGWRKIAPRCRHPKKDPAKQEAFKKTPSTCS